MDYLKILFQHLLPQHILSRLAGKLAKCRVEWLKNFLIHAFIKHYGVAMDEAAEPNPNNYPDFNSFFTRSLRPQARRISLVSRAIISPVDSQVSQIGKINKRQLIQAKGKKYSLQQLLEDNELAKLFTNGSFATLYLSPKDYHRIHMPITGKLRYMLHIPGNLFSVNPPTTNKITSLFGRNERVINIFDTLIGPMAVVLVGAMIVGSVATSWYGVVMPTKKKYPQIWDYTQHQVVLQRGEEMGYFQLGSTVILLFAQDAITWLEHIKQETNVQMGQYIGKIN